LKYKGKVPAFRELPVLVKRTSLLVQKKGKYCSSSSCESLYSPPSQMEKQRPQEKGVVQGDTTGKVGQRETPLWCPSH
jgi:hypothetical protein